jgi:lipopolysaccharide transport system ATP-binding protein
MNNVEIAIRVEKVGKYFKMYQRKRDIIRQIIVNKAEYFQRKEALKSISFELKRGESLGIVGRNGSGKSTLLQIICQTLKQSYGEVEVNGKVGALLELGSGFNPEFTGRENVYINGILLGLSKKEVEERLNDIIDFAEIGEFIDQPIKTYSSGMIVRLAFAVLANSEADVLIIDEALAVGDAYFTQKCMRYIQRFRKTGSLLFVSHDANAILGLCDRAILIDNGIQKLVGSPKEVMEEYTKEIHKSNIDKSISTSREDQNINESKDIDTKNIIADEYSQKWIDYRSKAINKSSLANIINIEKFDKIDIQKESYGGKEMQIVSTNIVNIESNEKELNYIKGGEMVRITITAKAKNNISNIIAGFILKNKQGLNILGDNTLNNMIEGDETNFMKGEIMKANFVFTMPLLAAGEYSITSSIATGSLEQHNILHWVNDSLILVSQCSSISAGIAGVPMQSITLEKIENENT